MSSLARSSLNTRSSAPPDRSTPYPSSGLLFCQMRIRSRRTSVDLLSDVISTEMPPPSQSTEQPITILWAGLSEMPPLPQSPLESKVPDRFLKAIPKRNEYPKFSVSVSVSPVNQQLHQFNLLQ